MIAIAPDIERLARRVADKLGSTPENVIRRAVEASARAAGLAQGHFAADAAAKIAAARAILARGDKRPILDTRSPDDILDYDNNGLPR